LKNTEKTERTDTDLEHLIWFATTTIPTVLQTVNSSGGVAWDAVPLTVRGLNKAAGNPPFFQGQNMYNVF